MAQSLDQLRLAAKLASQGIPFVLATVTGTKGSTPRDAGAKIVFVNDGAAETLSEDASETGWKIDGAVRGYGTVGGGQFELLVADAAQRHLAKRTSGCESYVLGSDADQCCGGVMEVFFEYIGHQQRVVIFGAGHVSHELAKLLEPAGLHTVIVDDRPQWNTAERFPGCTRLLSWEEGVQAAGDASMTTLACVMTCSHDVDLTLLRALLRSPPAFVGLIGSRSKRICLFGRLIASGVDEHVVARVQCPVGVGDCGKEPALVALSIAAGLLLQAKRLAGAEVRKHQVGVA